MNKRGQFYLVAAMIIISIMLGFMAYQSHLRTVPVSQKVYDLGKELDLETAQVLDYGIYSSPSQQQAILNSWANNFSQYSSKKSEQEKFIFVYYDKNSAQFKGTEFTSVDSGCIGVGDEFTSICTEEPVATDVTSSCSSTDDKITCIIGTGETATVFSFNKDENFYFVIKGTGGEVAQK